MLRRGTVCERVTAVSSPLCWAHCRWCSMTDRVGCDTVTSQEYGAADLSAMMRVVDKDGDGKIDFDEFRELLLTPS